MILVMTALKAESKGFNDKRSEYLGITGIGKVNAAMHLTHQLRIAAPHIPGVTGVVNLGTCGGTFAVAGDGIARPGEIMHPTAFTDGSPAMSKFPDDFPQIGDKDAKTTCVTDDVFHFASRYTVRDMEAYALAKVCKHFDIPFHCYKIVTDTGNSKDWELNLPRYMELLWAYYYKEVYPGLVK